MKLIGKSIETLLKRPLVLIYWGLVIGLLFFVFSNVYEVIYSFLFSSGEMFVEGVPNESAFQTLMTLLVSAVSNVANASLGLKIILYGVLGIIALCVVNAFFFSGYNNTVYQCFSKRQNGEAGFFYGIKRFFLKNTIVTIAFIFAYVVLLVLLVVAAMPTLTAFLYMFRGQTSLTVAYLFAIITGIVSFFTFMYITVYLTQWFPAVFSGKGNSFKLSCFVINRNFWAIFVRYFLFIVAMVVVNVLVSCLLELCGLVMTDIAALIVSGVINTVMISFFTVYNFVIFRFFFAKTKVEMRAGEE